MLDGHRYTPGSDLQLFHPSKFAEGYLVFAFNLSSKEIQSGTTTIPSDVQLYFKSRTLYSMNPNDKCKIRKNKTNA